MPVTYRDPGRVEFTAKIRVQGGGGAFVEFPHDVENLYGLKGRVPVKVTFDGIPYRGSMVKMGGRMHLLLTSSHQGRRYLAGRTDDCWRR